MDIDNLWVNGCNWGDINVDFEFVRIHALFNHLVTDIKLKPFPHERTGGPAVRVCCVSNILEQGAVGSRRCSQQAF